MRSFAVFIVGIFFVLNSNAQVTLPKECKDLTNDFMSLYKMGTMEKRTDGVSFQDADEQYKFWNGIGTVTVTYSKGGKQADDSYKFDVCQANPDVKAPPGTTACSAFSFKGGCFAENQEKEKTMYEVINLGIRTKKSSGFAKRCIAASNSNSFWPCNHLFLLSGRQLSPTITQPAGPDPVPAVKR